MNMKKQIKVLGILTALFVSFTMTGHVSAVSISELIPISIGDHHTHVAQSQTHIDQKGNLYVVWQEWVADIKTKTPLNAAVYFKKSMDGGLTWSMPLPLSNQVSKNIPSRKTPHLKACYGNNGEIYVVWFSQSSINVGGYNGGFRMNYSTDSGETWQEDPIAIIDIRSIHTGTGGDVGRIRNVSLDCDDQGHAILKWEDNQWQTGEYDYGLSRFSYSKVISTIRQLAATEIFVNAYPDSDSVYYPDDNMIDYDNTDTGGLTYWVGSGGANSQWCIEIDLGEERKVVSLEIDWYYNYTSSNFDILEMSEENYVTNGTPRFCDGEIIYEGLSQEANMSPPYILSTSVIDLRGLTTDTLGIRINEMDDPKKYPMPVISEIRVKVWD